MKSDLIIHTLTYSVHHFVKACLQVTLASLRERRTVSADEMISWTQIYHPQAVSIEIV